jgi:hypothetical protein
VKLTILNNRSVTCSSELTKLRYYWSVAAANRAR